MDIRELRKQPHLSASSISSYIECGLNYKFSRIDKLKPEYVSDNLVYGSTIHKVIADYHQERMVGNILSVLDLQDLFETYWQESAEDNTSIKYSRTNNFQKIMTEGKALLKVYHQCLPRDTYNIVAIEEPFVFYPPGMEIPLIGVMDLVEEDSDHTLIITDHKTSSKAYSNTQIDKNLQMTVYQLAARSNGYQDRNILLRIDCLIKTKSPGFKQYYTSRSGLDEYRMIRKMQKVCNGIQRGIFIPNDTSWKCGYCEYKSYCDDWFAQGYKETSNGSTEQEAA